MKKVVISLLVALVAFSIFGAMVISAQMTPANTAYQTSSSARSMPAYTTSTPQYTATTQMAPTYPAAAMCPAKAYSAPTTAYTCPAKAYSAPTTAYTCPAKAYSASTTAYTCPAKTSVQCPSCAASTYGMGTSYNGMY